MLANEIDPVVRKGKASLPVTRLETACMPTSWGSQAWLNLGALGPVRMGPAEEGEGKGEGKDIMKI